MKAEFVCDYLHNSGKICGKASTRPEGCRLHFKAKKGQFCTEPWCRNVTRIPCGRCREHIGGYYQLQYVNKLRDKAQMYDRYSSEKGET